MWHRESAPSRKPNYETGPKGNHESQTAGRDELSIFRNSFQLVSVLFRIKRQRAVPITCVQSGTGVWQNYAFTGQSSQFVVTYSATPSHAAMTGEVGFSVNAASSLTNLAVIVRFASTGVIDVRNGGSFSAATSYPYTAGTQYAFQLAINPATKRYSVFVTAPGGAQVELASNYAFRSSQSRISSLNNWATYSTGGTETVCNMTIAGAGSSVTAPTISAQPASKTVTAGQTATFSVTASGTAPLSYQWAKNGAAISGATGPATPRRPRPPRTTDRNSWSPFPIPQEALRAAPPSSP